MLQVMCIVRIVQFKKTLLLYTNIDQSLVNSFNVLLNCEIGGLDCRVITTRTDMCRLCTNVTPIL